LSASNRLSPVSYRWLGDRLSASCKLATCTVHAERPAALLRSYSYVLGLHTPEDGGRSSSETLVVSHVRKVTYRQHSDSPESRLTPFGGTSRQCLKHTVNEQLGATVDQSILRTGDGLDVRGITVRLPAEPVHFSLSRNSRPSLDPTQPPTQPGAKLKQK
jgi:hypothetical protein